MSKTSQPSMCLVIMLRLLHVLIVDHNIPHSSYKANRRPSETWRTAVVRTHPDVEQSEWEVGFEATGPDGSKKESPSAYS